MIRKIKVLTNLLPLIIIPLVLSAAILTGCGTIKNWGKKSTMDQVATEEWKRSTLDNLTLTDKTCKAL